MGNTRQKGKGTILTPLALPSGGICHPRGKAFLSTRRDYTRKYFSFLNPPPSPNIMAQIAGLTAGNNKQTKPHCLNLIKHHSTFLWGMAGNN